MPWLSRMRDGRFNRKADDYGQNVIPGLFAVDAPDVRPILKRERADDRA